jgi:hypothetical protein
MDEQIDWKEPGEREGRVVIRIGGYFRKIRKERKNQMR